MTPDKFQKAYGRLVAKAWEDEAFKTELLSEPMKVFKENGLEVPDGIKVRIVENTDKLIYCILPPEPSDELSDEALNEIDGGYNPFNKCDYGFCTPV